MRILALDIGKKRIGVALSTSGIIASEFATFTNDQSTIEKIEEIVKKEDIEKIIVGLPKNMDGTNSEYTYYVLNFEKKIKKYINIPIIFEDERLTTKDAELKLKAMGLSADEVKRRIDQFAAKLILEQYLG
jgi:putative holliday junction resolvase